MYQRAPGCGLSHPGVSGPLLEKVSMSPRMIAPIACLLGLASSSALSAGEAVVHNASNRPWALVITLEASRPGAAAASALPFVGAIFTSRWLQEGPPTISRPLALAEGTPQTVALGPYQTLRLQLPDHGVVHMEVVDRHHHLGSQVRFLADPAQGGHLGVRTELTGSSGSMGSTPDPFEILPDQSVVFMPLPPTRQHSPLPGRKPQRRHLL